MSSFSPRLRKIGRHLEGGQEVDADVAAAPGVQEEEPAAKDLSTLQLTSFIRDGFLLLPTVDELPAGFCDRFYDKAYELRDAPRDELWGSLTDEVNAVLAGPTCRGALTSLLGPDFLMPPGNSHMHVSFQGDQGFHKDGTDHGPTQGTVRDHRPRHILALFYPKATTLDMVISPTSNLSPRHAFLIWMLLVVGPDLCASWQSLPRAGPRRQVHIGAAPAVRAP